MTHRRIVRTFVVLAGSLLLAGGGYVVAARQAAPRPTSEQMGKVSLGEVGLAARRHPAHKVRASIMSIAHEHVL